jgi:tetratricopeptide (TPR) repeat protein
MIVFLLALVPLSAPLRADTAAYRGQEARIERNPGLAIEEFQKAIDLQPRNSAYLERLADLHEQNQMHDVAFAERQEIARLKPGNAFAAVQAARAAIRMNRLEVAGQWFEEAVLLDPHGAGVLVEAAGFFAKTGSVERANQLLETFEALDSRSLSKWQVASEIYDFLGDDEASKHASLCAVPGQVGC